MVFSPGKLSWWSLQAEKVRKYITFEIISIFKVLVTIQTRRCLGSYLLGRVPAWESVLALRFAHTFYFLCLMQCILFIFRNLPKYLILKFNLLHFCKRAAPMLLWIQNGPIQVQSQNSQFLYSSIWSISKCTTKLHRKFTEGNRQMTFLKLVWWINWTQKQLCRLHFRKLIWLIDWRQKQLYWFDVTVKPVFPSTPSAQHTSLDATNNLIIAAANVSYKGICPGFSGWVPSCCGLAYYSAWFEVMPSLVWGPASSISDSLPTSVHLHKLYYQLASFCCKLRKFLSKSRLVETRRVIEPSFSCKHGTECSIQASESSDCRWTASAYEASHCKANNDLTSFRQWKYACTSMYQSRGSTFWLCKQLQTAQSMSKSESLSCYLAFWWEKLVAWCSVPAVSSVHP